MKKRIVVLLMLLSFLFCACENAQDRAVREMREANEAYQDSLWELEKTKRELERVQRQIDLIEGAD